MPREEHEDKESGDRERDRDRVHDRDEGEGVVSVGDGDVMRAVRGTASFKTATSHGAKAATLVPSDGPLDPVTSSLSSSGWIPPRAACKKAFPAVVPFTSSVGDRGDSKDDVVAQPDVLPFPKAEAEAVAEGKGEEEEGKGSDRGDK